MKTPPEILAIIKYYEDFYHLSEGGIIDYNRSKTSVAARQRAHYLSRVTTSYSYEELGEFFNRDWSAIKYSVNKIKKTVTHKWKK